jgi:hypothetical protein
LRAGVTKWNWFTLVFRLVGVLLNWPMALLELNRVKVRSWPPMARMPLAFSRPWHVGAVPWAKAVDVGVASTASAFSAHEAWNRKNRHRADTSFIGLTSHGATGAIGQLY